MYLSALTKDKEKETFLRIAIIVAIADPRSEGEIAYKEEEGTSSLRADRFDLDREDAEKLFKIFPKKELEQDQLELFAKEMKLSSLENYEGVVETNFRKVISNLLEVSETTNSKLLTTEELRTDFLCDTVDRVMEECGSDSFQVAKRKAMLFELVGLAVADHVISNAERKILDHVCRKFDIDIEVIDEAAEIIAAMQTLRDRGLELIEE